MQEAEEQEHGDVNVTAVPKLHADARMDEFVITADLAEGRRWFIEGDAIRRFAQMTNWNYYESALRFQKVLAASGMPLALCSTAYVAWVSV